MRTGIRTFGFYIFYAAVWCLSLLPMRIQYFFSDLMYPVLYYLVRYRRKIVRKNLNRSFPEMRKKEIIHIEREFYRHLCDYFVESMALLNLSAKQISKRFTYKNIDLLNGYFQQGKSILVASGHYANWEWFAGAGLFTPFQPMAIYKRLNNPEFNEFFLKMRQKFGLVAVEMDEVLRKLFASRDSGIPTLLYFLTDQRPIRKNIRHWTSFLNQETPVYLGLEKIARKTHSPVFFMQVEKVRRGFYEAEFVLITDKPEETKEFEITECHLRILENQIKKKPEFWLWSHRRWRHNRKKVEAWQAKMKSVKNINQS